MPALRNPLEAGRATDRRDAGHGGPGMTWHGHGTAGVGRTRSGRRGNAATPQGRGSPPGSQEADPMRGPQGTDPPEPRALAMDRRRPARRRTAAKSGTPERGCVSRSCARAAIDPGQTDGCRGQHAGSRPFGHRHAERNHAWPTLRLRPKRLPGYGPDANMPATRGYLARPPASRGDSNRPGPPHHPPRGPDGGSEPQQGAGFADVFNARRRAPCPLCVNHSPEYEKLRGGPSHLVRRHQPILATAHPDPAPDTLARRIGCQRQTHGGP